MATGKPSFSEEVLRIIDSAEVFSGGKRHYELIKGLLPAEHQWITISGSMEAVAQAYTTAKTDKVVIFVSGDPYFYGFGNTLQRLLPEASVTTFPFFSSIQLLCNKAKTPYNSLKTISLHGRDWDQLATALLQSPTLLGILTDQTHSPAAIAQYLLKYGFHQYRLIIGEELTGKNEKVTTYSLKEASKQEYAPLNCCLLQAVKPHSYPLSYQDDQYIKLEGRPNLITKQPIRLQTLQMLGLQERSVFWDIGTCTGSIAIEAKMNFPELQVLAFEKRPECSTVFEQNTQQLSVPGIEFTSGDFFELPLASYTRPDVAFIGGHGGRLEEMLQMVNQVLADHGKIVMNTVLDTSAQSFQETLSKLNYQIQPVQTIHYHGFNPINILTAIKQ